MSDHSPRSSRELAERWAQAGAQGAELEHLCEGLTGLREQSLPPTPDASEGRPELAGVWDLVLARLDANRRRTRRRVQALALAVAAGVCALAVIRPWRAPEEPRQPIREMAAADAPRRASAGAPSPTLALDDGLVQLSPDAAVKHDPDGALRLEAGTLRIEIDPRPAGAPPLRFRAGDIQVEVVGTVFALHAEAGRGAVRVYEGAVILTHGGSSGRVDADSGPQPPAGPWPGDDLVTERWGREAGARHAAMRALRSRDAIVKPPVPPAPHAADAPAAASPGSDGRRQLGARPRQGKRLDVTIPPRKKSGRQRELRDYQAALDQLRSGDPSRAAEQFAAYLESYPDGLLREEARLSYLESLRRSGAHAAFAREARRWLESHGEDPRAPEVEAALRGEEDAPDRRTNF